MVEESFDFITDDNQNKRNGIDKPDFSCGSDQSVTRNYASYSATLSHILVVSIGPTIFILPRAFAMVGYLNASIGIILISALYAYNLHSLLNSAAIVQEIEKRENLSFAEIVKCAFEKGRINLKFLAPYMYELMNILFVISWGGELSFTIVFLANNLQDLFTAWESTFSIQWILGALLIPCAILTLIPCEKLSLLSALTGFIDILFVIVVMCDLYQDFRPSRFNFCEAMRPIENVPQFLAIIFFTLNFTGLAIPSRNLMKNPKKFESTFGVMHASLLIITCANIVFGFSGYLRYGQSVKDSLILNLSWNSTFSRIMLALYCLATYFSYPFLYFVIFKIVWEEWIKKLGINARIYNSFASKIFASICINVIVFAIVLTLPNLDLFTNLGGLICGVMDSFVIPSILQIILCPKFTSRTKFTMILMKNIVIILIGLVLFMFGLDACMNITLNSRTVN